MHRNSGSIAHDILLFLCVAETGSFTSAGKVFGLGRSAMGKAVARLEDRYGTRLLNRTTRAINLTQEGRALFDHGLRIRDALDAAEDDMAAGMQADGTTPRGTLRITAPHAIGRRLLMPVIRRFLADWDAVQVEISFSDQVDNLVEGGFDIAIRIGVTTPPLGLIARTILTDTPVLCASPEYLARHSPPTTPDQLSTHDVLLFASGHSRQGWKLQDRNGAWFRALGLSRLRLESGEALRDAALAGMGIALLPRLLIADDLRAGRLEPVLPEIDCGTVPIVALYPHRRHLEPRVRQFIDTLVAGLKRGETHPGRSAQAGG